MSFEANRGQAAASVNFLARGHGYSLFLTPAQAVFVLQDYAPLAAAPTVAPALRTAVLRMRVLGGSRRAQAAGAGRLPGQVNYLIGSDPRKWHIHIPLYAGVRYRQVYPGVDLLYHGSQQQLEYDFVVAPHVSPKTIRLGFQGPSAVTIDRDGGLVLQLGSRPMRWHRPMLYQMVGGKRKPVAGGYVLGKNQTVTFRVGAYDPTRPLVIDPVLAYSTYLGGTTIDDADAVAVGSDGCAYVAGRSGTPIFPNVTGLFDEKKTGVFVTKLDPTGSRIVYSTYFEDPSSLCGGIAVDAAGNAYVAGSASTQLRPDGSYGSDFPVTSGAYQRDLALAAQASVGFIAELSPDGGRLLYGTLLSGSQGARCGLIALDGRGRVYVAGITSSLDFPVTPGALYVPWAAPPGPAGPQPFGGSFVAEFDPKRSGRASRVYSALLGGTNIGGLAVDASGRAALVGGTAAADFPSTPGALQPEFVGHSIFGPARNSAFVAELDSTAGRLVYGTFFGGDVDVLPAGVALDPSGAIYIAGDAGPGLPMTTAAFQPTTSNHNPFVLKIDPAKRGAASLLYGTYLGGPGNSKLNGFADPSGISYASAIAVDAAGDAYISGSTDDPGFPTTSDAIEASYNPREQGATTVFLSILDPAGTHLLWSSYLGAGGNTDAPALALDRLGDAYIGGTTTFNLLPTTPGAYLQFAPGGLLDGFVLKVSGQTPPGPSIANIRPYPVFVGEGGQPLTITGSGFAPGAGVSFNGGPPVPAAVASPTRLTVSVPGPLAASPQPILVTVVNPPRGDWASAILPVIDPAPTVILLNPPSITSRTEDAALRIYGSGMFPGTVVSFNGGPPVPISYDMPSASFVDIPAGILAHPGPVDVAVINPAPRRGVAHATLMVTDGRSLTLTGSDLEGLAIYRRRIAPAGGDPGNGGDKVVATVTAKNDTRYHITSLTIRLDLFAPAPGGQATSVSVPYTVTTFLDPTDTQDVASAPLAPGLKAGTALTGYYMTLLSAQGTPVPMDPVLPPLSRLIFAASTGDMAALQESAQDHADLIRAGSVPRGAATALGEAAAAGHTAAVAFLLAHGAPINLADSAGYTPLLYGVSWDHPEVVRVLLAHHADRTIPDPQGLTPLQLATELASESSGDDAERQIVKMLQAGQLGR